MKLLALDSSGLVASVAVTDGDTLLGEYTLNYKKTHSQTLLPMLDTLAKMLELDLNTIDAIAVAGGPGSFTGLRIGSATAKGLGLALNKPLISVPTVDGLAANLWESKHLVCPIMDARRGQVYTGIYRFTDGKMEVLEPQCAVSLEEIIKKLEDRKEEVIFLGDGVPVYRQKIDAIMKEKHRYAPAHLNRQRAGAVAFLAAEYFKEGKTETAAMHRPEYLRLSQAERERLEKERLEKEKNDH